MDVLLDTNIYFDNYFLDSMRFRSLFGYLRKTGSKLLMPQVVKEELILQHEEKTMDYFRIMAELCEVKRTLLNDANVSGELKNSLKLKDKFYKKELDGLIKKHSVIVLPVGQVQLKDIFLRCMNRTKPFGQSEKYPDAGFKDALIWQCLMDRIAKKNQICFISNDRVAFGTDTLYAELKAEVDRMKADVHYFNNLGKFLAQHFADLPSDKINTERLSRFVTTPGVFDAIDEGLYRSLFEDQFNGNVEEVVSDHITLDDYYIYNVENKIVYIELKLTVDVSESWKEIAHDEGAEITIDQGSEHSKLDVSLDVSFDLNKDEIKLIDNSYRLNKYLPKRMTRRFYN